MVKRLLSLIAAAASIHGAVVTRPRVIGKVDKASQGATPTACCLAMTPTCLACQQGVSLDTFCRGPANSHHEECQGYWNQPPAQSQAQDCCKHAHASCFSCQMGVTLHDFCSQPGRGTLPGCEATPVPKACCNAMTAECMACQDNMPVEQWCAHSKQRGAPGCERYQSGGATLPYPSSPQTRPQPISYPTQGQTRPMQQQQQQQQQQQRPRPQPMPSPAQQPRPAQEQPQACCMAMTAPCMACQSGLSVPEWCRAHPESGNYQECQSERPVPRPSSPVPSAGCCREPIAKCLSCHSSMPVNEWCKAVPARANIDGCQNQRPQQQRPQQQPQQQPSSPPVCCMAMTSQCLSCQEGMPEGQWCRLNPGVPGCDRSGSGGVSRPSPEVIPSACCKAMTLSCMACQAGLTQQQFCIKNPYAPVCSSSRPQQPTVLSRPTGTTGPTACCKAMTLECLACSAGVSQQDFCGKNPYAPVCPKPQQQPSQAQTGPKVGGCCKAYTAECLACEDGMTVESFCHTNPSVFGCEDHNQRSTLLPQKPASEYNNCCTGNHASCYACQNQMPVEDYCWSRMRKGGGLNFPGCEGLMGETICCLEINAECLSCNEGKTIEQWCAIDQRSSMFDDCPGGSTSKPEGGSPTDSYPNFPNNYYGLQDATAQTDVISSPTDNQYPVPTVPSTPSTTPPTTDISTWFKPSQPANTMSEAEAAWQQALADAGIPASSAPYTQPSWPTASWSFMSFPASNPPTPQGDAWAQASNPPPPQGDAWAQALAKAGFSTGGTYVSPQPLAGQPISSSSPAPPSKGFPGILPTTPHSSSSPIEATSQTDPFSAWIGEPGDVDYSSVGGGIYTDLKWSAPTGAVMRSQIRTYPSFVGGMVYVRGVAGR